MSLVADSQLAAPSQSVSHSYLLASCFIQATSSASQAELTLRQAGPFISTKLLQLDNLFQLSFSVPSPSVTLSLSFPLSPPCPPPLHLRCICISHPVFCPVPLVFLNFPTLCFYMSSVRPWYQVAQQYRWPLFISAMLRTLSHLSRAAVFRNNLSVNYARTETQKMLFFIFVCWRVMLAGCFAQARKVIL